MSSSSSRTSAKGGVAKLNTDKKKEEKKLPKKCRVPEGSNPVDYACDKCDSDLPEEFDAHLLCPVCKKFPICALCPYTHQCTSCRLVDTDLVECGCGGPMRESDEESYWVCPDCEEMNCDACFKCNGCDTYNPDLSSDDE